MLRADLVGLERRETLEAHVEDRLRLRAGELELVHQPVPRRIGIGGAANQGDNRVEVVEGDEKAFEDVGPGLGATQLVLRPAGDDLALVVDVVVDQLAQAQRLRNAVHERDHVDAEARLDLGLLVEVVEDDVGHRAALQLDHDAHAGAVRLVAQVGDPVELLLPDEFGDLGDETAVAALLDLEGELGDDQRVLAALERLDVDAAPDPDAAAARAVGLPDMGRVHDAPAGEVRPLDVGHQTLEIDLRVIDVRRDRGVGLTQVVRRDVGRHADRDAGGAVDEQVREPRGQDQRLAL